MQRGRAMFHFGWRGFVEPERIFLESLIRLLNDPPLNEIMRVRKDPSDIHYLSERAGLVCPPKLTSKSFFLVNILCFEQGDQIFYPPGIRIFSANTPIFC